MEKVKNLLFTCAGGNAVQYLAKRLLGRFNVFLVDGSDQSFIAGEIGAPFVRVPFGNDPAYVPEIKKLVSNWQIDFIVPGADEELVPLAEAYEEAELPPLVMPSLVFTQSVLHKKNLMKILADKNISKLLPFENIEEIKYPAVAKPIYGRGSREFHIIKNPTELDGYLKLYGKHFGEIVVEPYIAGDEYTVSVIVNNKNKIIGIVPKKVILKRGITRVAVSEKNEVIDTVCRKVIAELDPRGPLNVQLKFFENQVYIFEINPRLSTTAVLTDQCFGNEVELFIKYFGDEKIDHPPIMKENVFLYRFDQNYFRS